MNLIVTLALTLLLTPQAQTPAENPTVGVELEPAGTQSVIVRGMVRTPGRIPFTGTKTLLDALADAGLQMAQASTEITVAGGSMYWDYGKGGSRFDDLKVHKPKKVSLGPKITLDTERCIMCSRCERFMREVAPHFAA